MARWTQTKLVSTIQDYMDSVAARIDRQPLRQKLDTEHRLLGMTNLAKRLGVACDCFYTEWIAKPGFRLPVSFLPTWLPLVALRSRPSASTSPTI